MSIALQKLRAIQAESGSLLCVGLEPCPEYLFSGITTSASGYKTWLRVLINATHGLVCAYKFNLAFFEALRTEGMDLLYTVREMIPPDVLVIADAKRCDIGSSARRYAMSLYDFLNADAATVNPLMGRDSVEPFLEYRDKLTFLLCLTSNPGAGDFLIGKGLYRDIALKAAEWNEAENVGLVVGATRAIEHIAEIRQAAPTLPFLVPGIGAQGGAAEDVIGAGRIPGDFSGLVFHVTRGILPNEEEQNEEPREVIRRKTLLWRDRIYDAFAESNSTNA